MEEKHEILKQKLTKETDEQLEKVLEEGVSPDNIAYVGKLVDIIKDKENIIYWKEKMKMMYGNYGRGSYNEGSYGRRRRDSRGRYMEGSRSGRYRGDDMMEEMYEKYQEYSEGRENYGADHATLQSLETMLDSVKKFMKHLEKEASSREEVEMIKDTAREIGEM